MSDENPIDLDKERRLNQAINRLASDEPPVNDLWPSIEAELKAFDRAHCSTPVKQKTTNAESLKKVETKLLPPSWHSWAIAASLVLCVGSVSYSWLQLEKADAIYAEVNQIQRQIDSGTSSVIQPIAVNTVSLEQPAQKFAAVASKAFDNQEVNASYYIRQVDAMEKEFKAARASLMARIAMNSANIDEALLAQIETELMEIDRATLVLKKAMGRQQVDANFTNLLRLTYQQELTVLTQLAKLDTTI